MLMLIKRVCLMLIFFILTFAGCKKIDSNHVYMKIKSAIDKYSINYLAKKDDKNILAKTSKSDFEIKKILIFDGNKKDNKLIATFDQEWSKKIIRVCSVNFVFEYDGNKIRPLGFEFYNVFKINKIMINNEIFLVILTHNILSIPSVKVTILNERKIYSKEYIVDNYEILNDVVYFNSKDKSKFLDLNNISLNDFDFVSR